MTWSIARILETLEMKIAMGAMAGKQAPVSKLVVARIKASL